LPETVSGGNALKFYATQRIDIRRETGATATKDDSGTLIAAPTKVKFVKNKLAPPFSTALITVERDVGINQVAELVDLASELDLSPLLSKGGSWYTFSGLTDKIQGRETAIEELNKPKHAPLRLALTEKVKSLYFPVIEPEEEVDNDTIDPPADLEGVPF